MARWSNSTDEMNKIAQFSEKAASCILVKLMLEDGKTVEGALRGVNVKNNGFENNTMRFSGEFKIVTKDHQSLVIDFLDTKSVENAWSDEAAAEYEKLGVIKLKKKNGKK